MRLVTTYKQGEREAYTRVYPGCITGCTSLGYTSGCNRVYLTRVYLRVVYTRVYLSEWYIPGFTSGCNRTIHHPGILRCVTGLYTTRVS